jgi:simple sugar transport system ATP-binding protein
MDETDGFDERRIHDDSVWRLALCRRGVQLVEPLEAAARRAEPTPPASGPRRRKNGRPVSARDCSGRPRREKSMNFSLAIDAAQLPTTARRAILGDARVFDRQLSGGGTTMALGGGEFDSVVRLVGVQKYFGAVHALRDIDIAIGRNEIVGLIGDNGAGKSTLIKVMTGVLAPTAGKIYIRDREIPQSEYSVRMAHDLSIETVYQDKSLADKQPLWRNFFVGRQITDRFGFIDIKREKEVAQRILIDVIGFRGVGITVDSTVSKLSGGERQGIAIGRAMHYKADLIVLDEPTAALGVAEVRKVIDFVRLIKSSGRACIYIEHNLAHVHEVADRLVVLDRGRIVSEINPRQMSVNELTEYLIDLQHKG